MDIPEHRRWIDRRCYPGRGGITPEFYAGVDTFIEVASAQQGFSTPGDLLKCPCKKCECLRFKSVNEVKRDLCKYGFMKGYYYWTIHGEEVPLVSDRVNDNEYYREDNMRDRFNPFEQMVMDAAGPSCGPNIMRESGSGSGSGYHPEYSEEPPNENANAFYEMLSTAQAPLYSSCETETELSAAVRMLSIKSDYNMPEGCYNEVMQYMHQAMPAGNRVPNNFYHTKKLVSQLGMGVKKIDCCLNGCMLYYKNDETEMSCKFCRQPRFKPSRRGVGTFKPIPFKRMWYLPLIPRLQRVYASPATAVHMRWHHTNRGEQGILRHPCDGEAWKYFDQTYPDFSVDPRNVRLGLCADGFTPYGQSGRSYSCWPVIVTPYNLPPGMCLRREFMFLTAIIPGPSNPKHKIDVFLQPLMDELQLLWHEGVLTYDVSTKNNFMMKAALLWTVNDFPAYGMLSGWMTAGRLACPYCMEKTKAFNLKFGRKTSYFDSHRQFLPMDHQFRKNTSAFRKNRVEKSPPPPRLTGENLFQRVCNIPSVLEQQDCAIPGYGVHHNWTKRSIFWDLPYWKDCIIRHNLDVMHIEKNIFDNLFNTVMDVKGKSKDNTKARMDIKEYCRRKELELVDRGGGKFWQPKAQYTLTREQKLSVLRWIKELKLPDGYASRLGRCVELNAGKISGLKSHDCHVLIERLIPSAFRPLPDRIWNPVTELCQFFKEICSTTLRIDNLEKMEQNIPIILCKLERIFPPGWFNSMEHLPVHLVYEAKVGGPVQYRWMYPFERFLHSLKKKVRNKARVEGSICEAYLIEEISTFGSYYFETNVQSRRTRVQRNDDGGESSHPPISIFNYPGRAAGSMNTRWLDEKEFAAAKLYVLLNTPEVEPFLTTYTNMLRELYPDISDELVDQQIEEHFVIWFHNHVNLSGQIVADPIIQSIAWGPSPNVRHWSIYFVNGYKFQTVEWSEGRSTENCGVCVTGWGSGTDSINYYGRIIDIIELEYAGLPIKRVIMFKCDWYDPSPRGTKIHDKYGIVEVRSSRRYKKYDPFIFAHQAEQVYYAPYPATCRDKLGWMVVIKTKARGTIDAPEVEIDEPFQEDDILQMPQIDENDDFVGTLQDVNGLVEEVDVNIELQEQDDTDEESTSEEDEEELLSDERDSDEDVDEDE